MNRTTRFLLFMALLMVVVAPGLAVDVADAGDTRAKARTPKDAALIELGRRLFFDPLVSRSGERSCASCHDPDFGFSDPEIVSEDDVGVTKRHSQTILNAHLNPSAHWDGEFETIEELVLARLGVPSGRKGLRGHGTTFFDDRVSGRTDPGATDTSDTDRPSDHGHADEAPEEREAGDAADEDAERRQKEKEEDEKLREEFFKDMQKATTSGNGTGNGPGRDPDAYTGQFGKPSGSIAPGARNPRDGDDGDSPGGGASQPQDDGGTDAGGSSSTTDNQPGTTTESKRADQEGDRADDAESAAEKEQRMRDVLEDLRKLPRVADLVEQGGRYDEGFKAAFGSSSVTTARLARAIAAYCRSVESTEAPYDRFVDGDETAIGEAAQRGLELFEGRAGCAQCHTTKGDAALTDFGFHNTGIAWMDLDAEAKDAAQVADLDLGRAGITGARRDTRAFKTATLRDLTRRGPYMHTGRFRNLAEVVYYYAGGGSGDPAQDKRIKAFDVAPAEVADLVAFLETLTGTERPGLAPEDWRHRTCTTSLRFVDGKGRPMPDLHVRLLAVGDRVGDPQRGDDDSIDHLTEDDGRIEIEGRRPRTHFRIELPDGLVTSNGHLVPDTCRHADVVVPVDGKAAIVVVFPTDATAPASVRLDHLGTIVLQGHEAPRSTFRLTGVAKSAGGMQVARYEGWFRTDVPADVRVFLPGKARDVTLDPENESRIDLTR